MKGVKDHMEVFNTKNTKRNLKAMHFQILHDSVGSLLVISIASFYRIRSVNNMKICWDFQCNGYNGLATGSSVPPGAIDYRLCLRPVLQLLVQSQVPFPLGGNY